jgi:RNA polymerase sigma-70 factor (ECF subfamily)
MSTPDPLDHPPTPPGANADDRPAHLQTSLSLLHRARCRDQEAWNRLYYLYRPLVLYWCSRRGVLHGDADDAVQEVFRVVARSLDRFRRDRPGDTFRGWLHGITHNVILMHFRRGRGEVRAAGGSDAHDLLEQVTAPTGPLEEDPAEQISELYRRGLELVRGDFEDRSWQMFWRSVIDGRRSGDVAAEMGATAAAVRQAKSRVLRRLREVVGDLVDC